MTTNIELTFPQSNDLLSVLITFHSDGDHGREGPDLALGGAHLHLEEVHGREGPDLEGAHLHLVEVYGAIQVGQLLPESESLSLSSLLVDRGSETVSMAHYPLIITFPFNVAKSPLFLAEMHRNKWDLYLVHRPAQDSSLILLDHEIEEVFVAGPAF